MQLSLDEAAEIARHRLGEEEVNRYLYQQFSSFSFGTAHLALVQLPWDVMYTTNYDLLVENAAKAASIEPSGIIQPIFSTKTELTPFSEKHILYYKLHGSIDVANTEEGHLILTKEDFRFYELYRKSLFGRLKRDFLRRTFVFVGYALQDTNLRAILEDCLQELGARTFPLSFSIRPNFSRVEETFWRDKYNVQLIPEEAGTFLNALKDTWPDENRSVVPFDIRRSKIYLSVESHTRFPKVGESFYQISPADCTGASNPRLFFHGGEPSWNDIRDKIAPQRDAYWTIFDSFFPELVEPNQPRPVSSNGTEIYASSSNSVLASWRSAVSKPSVNQP